jgi:hypothetical protein
MDEVPPQADSVERVLAFADRLRASPGGGPAAALLAERSRRRLWLGEIPVATEATVGALLQFLAQHPNGSAPPIQLVLRQERVQLRWVTQGGREQLQPLAADRGRASEE